nr:hypothetical protein OG409_10490 [Streptomyces sp. NBC_00974]
MREGRWTTVTESEYDHEHRGLESILAAVKLCPECRTRELFLLNQVRDGKLTLRSLEEHTLEIQTISPGEEASGEHPKNGPVH